VNRSCFLNLAAWRTRSSACDTRARHCVRFVLCWFAFPRPRPWLHRLRRRSTSGFVRRLPSYFGEVRLLGLVHHRLRLLAFPMRAGSAIRPNPRSPGSHTKSVRTCQGLRHAEPGGRSRCRLRSYCFPRQRPCLRSEQESFSRLYGCLCVPLSTLRRRPHGRLRMTRGHCGSLLLQCSGTLTTYSSPVSPAHP